MVSVNDNEKEVIEFWKKNKTFEKSLKKTENGKPYIFYDGPPFATGLPHYGHLLASILKDVFPRFFTMKGRYVERVWGWDCHGLPVENIAEKELGIDSKEEIEKKGVKKFNNFCRSKVLTYADEWEKYIERIGRWVDFDKGYKTMDLEYIESVWWAFKQLYEKDYLYEGEKVLMYCPRCSTPLAKSEIAMDNSYKNVKDLSVVAKFKIKDESDTYALAWTTTPWTLPSNLALAVNPEMEYVFVKDKDGSTYILAKELVSKFYKDEKEYDVSKVVKGKDLEGMEYEPLFDYFKDNKNSFKFILGDFITAEEGTGIVHTAPAFGEEDSAICRKYKIPSVQPVDEKGHFTEEVKDYAGEYVHDMNEKIVIDLKKAGKAIFSQKIEHEYPFCYRCDTKLIYRALPAWFVDVHKVKKKLQKFNLKINWIPEFLKEGRMKYNIENAPDWNITRNRYWASAIPLWRSESGKIKVLGSIEELKKFAKNLKGDVDLHKDFLDDVVLEIDGEKYKRIPEVLDCWFESGSMPFAQFHYPFENKEYFEKNFPADFVVEYIGQTRAWFYYMMVLSAILFEKIPFENVLTTGTILAEDGQKMSKSKKNYPDPLGVIEKYGADALRFYLLSSSVMNADNFNFSEKGLEETYRKVILILYNVANFYLGYRADGDEKFGGSDNLMDKWILAKTEELKKSVGENLENYNTVKACEEIQKYIDGLSTWYVKISRERFSEGDVCARKTLRNVLVEVSKVLAPILPFTSEKIFRDLNASSSVHLEDWPKQKKSVNSDLLEKMEKLQDVVSEALKQRDQNSMGIRWPLASAKISEDFGDDYLEIFKQLVNVKEVSKGKNLEGNVELDFEPTEDLEAEGYSNELARKIQAARKKEDLVKDDKIKIEISMKGKLVRKIQEFLNEEKERVGASEINFVENVGENGYKDSGKIKKLEYSLAFQKV